MNNIFRSFIIMLFVFVAFPFSAIHSMADTLSENQIFTDSNSVSNGQMRLSFFCDHITYSFGDVVKKAIRDNGGSAGSFIYTNATVDHVEFSGDGDVTTNTGHIEIPRLHSGLFTFVVTTGSGEYKISCIIKNGAPIYLLNQADQPQHPAGEYLDYIENQDVCISVYNDNLKIILKKDAQKYILENDNDNDGAFIGVIPTLGMDPGYEGTIDPAGVNYIPLRHVFQKGKSGTVLILIDNGENDNCVKCLVDILDGKIRLNN